MTSTAPTTIESVNQPDEDGEIGWLNVSSEFNAAMMKGLETRTFEDSKSGKTVDMYKARRAGTASSNVTFLPMSQLRDIQGRPIIYSKRYLFREANRERNCITDIEKGNLKRVVNNTKWNDSLFFKIHRKYN